MHRTIDKLLACKYPILMGAMQWISTAEFVAAVCNGGGFAFIAASSFSSPGELRDEIRKTRTLTDMPFGVNISMLPSTEQNDVISQFADVVISEGVKVLETSGRNPKDLVAKVKDAGIFVLHKVTAAQHAVSAEKLGVDAIIAVGYEAAGHPGMSQVGSFVNLPAIVKAVSLPVIAAGGVCSGRSMAAAFLLGAKGIMMGTRFLATKEAPIHDSCKQWMLNASEKDTMILLRAFKNAMRCINNEKAYEVLGMEMSNASFNEIYPHIRGYLGEQAWKKGDMESSVLTMGQSIGLIDEILTVEELIVQMVRDASKALQEVKEDWVF